ncbi:MAG TPA: hypothetical protein PKV48_00920 [Thermodesulfobacteriota bacterium]|nr:hypothetical protein [Thermodesulfobacteriota bacterium]
MIESNFTKLIEEFSDIINLVEQLEISEEEQVSRLKAKDGKGLFEDLAYRKTIEFVI